MFSVVVVGRNDSHGYNLSKRVATSLNSMADSLTEEDEIIFVDWNTPVFLPPMPMTIQSELTDHCRSKLKIVRIPPSIHNQVKNDSNKNLLEPIARNVGLRATNPNSTWVLSTNTDMIFLTGGKSFSELVSNLDFNLWTTYRYELPEYLWESLASNQPKSVHEQVQMWHKTLDLPRKYFNAPREYPGLRIVDGVGDFQLAPRSLWELIGGFPEEMLHGWHVDSRATVAFYLKLNKPAAILSENQLIAYHQNHYRTLTPYHTSNMNSSQIALLPYQNQPNWGLCNFQFESTNLVDELRKSISTKGLVEIPTNKVLIETSLESISESHGYELSHVAIFLNDYLVNLPAKSSISVLSNNDQLIEFILKNYSTEYIVQHSNFENCKTLKVEDLLIIDFGSCVAEPTSKKSFLGLLNNLHYILSELGNHDTAYVFIRVQNWGIRTLVSHFFAIPLFNNYGQVFSGFRKRQKTSNWKTLFKLKLAFFGVITDYMGNEHQAPFSSQIFSKSRLVLFVWKLYKKLPYKIRSFIRRVLKTVIA